jgi:hypothetical protein
LYVQKDNSKGFATLIKNERKDQNDNHFRMVRLNCFKYMEPINLIVKRLKYNCKKLATIYGDDKDNLVFDIVPVKDKNEALNRKYKKRSLTDNMFYHVIHKRATRVDSQTENESEKISESENNVLDYLELPSNLFLILRY